MIELPEIFKNDTQGSTTHLVPLVIINNRLYLSTQKTKLDDKIYSPLLSKMGNISEGVNYNDRKYKVSNCNISFFNYTYNNKKLIDVIMQQEAFNTPLEIYFKSQNAKTLSDCLKVYSGYIKSIDENKDDIKISCEDKTEQVLGKDIPQRFTPTSEQLNEKHRNIPIPIVYGEVDRCPLVYIEGDDTNNKLIVDDKYINTISQFKLFTNDSYLEVVLEPNEFRTQSQNTLYETAQLNQWQLNDRNEIIIDKTIDLKDPVNADATDTYLNECSPIRYGFVEVLYRSDVRFVNGYYRVIKAVSGDVADNTYGVAPIRLYKGIEDNDEGNSLYDSYIDVRDFGTIPDVVADGKHWIYTSDHNYFEVGEHVDYWGKTWINCETDKMPDESKIVFQLRTSLLDTSAEEYTEPKDIIPCRVRTSHNIDFGVYKDFWDNLPNLFKYLPLSFYISDNFRAGGAAVRRENVQEQDLNYIANSTGVSSWFIQSTNITNTDMNMTNYHYDGHRDKWVVFEQAGSLQYVKINDLQVQKKVILDDFSEFKLYAHAFGRLDNSDMRYTASITTLRTEASGFRPTRNVMEAQARPTAVRTKPTKVKQTPKKPVKKQSKTSSKGGY